MDPLAAALKSDRAEGVVCVCGGLNPCTFSAPSLEGSHSSLKAFMSSALPLRFVKFPYEVSF